MYLLYTTLLTLSFIALIPYFAYHALRNKKYIPNLRYRLGWTLPIQSPHQPSIWIHAVSVGETLAVQPLMKLLHGLGQENCRLVFSTTTLTGQAVARTRFSEWATVIYFPIDFPHSVRRVLEAINPSLVLVVETEIWPNFLRACGRRGIPVILINGRISQRSFRGYSFLGPIISRVLNQFRLLLMQTQVDADRALALGADPNRVAVTGNLKYDIDTPDQQFRRIEEVDQLFGLRGGHLIVAGSTAPGEESILLDAFANLLHKPTTRDIRLLIAPRHPERFNEVAAIIRKTGLHFVRRSEPDSMRAGQAVQVILLDSLGELAAVYAMADIVFIGGSLVPVGGHNILEPALFGKPIVVGPHMSNFQAIIQEFKTKDAIIQLHSPNELEQVFHNLIQDPNRRRTLGENARAVLNTNGGATRRTVAAIAPYLPHSAV